ncbi:hypothetical protein SASPL_153401 [Salvia splendens]|uniref:NAD-dependent epimerase/dehydratase domain-containing protein n=1 Tax=Salvia splendens TaxID=180675 RepID=A0A8X8Z251_SALSN|nr:hypothetical protein SASPL_153401 [Salvia splendens]
MAENVTSVCVTGAGGFIASWLIKLLLSRGYAVHGTVRNPAEKLKLFKVDLIDFDSILAAVRGCEGVFHIASPATTTAANPEVDIVEPAVVGTLNVLKACSEAKVRRVVLVSSYVAVVVNPSAPKAAEAEARDYAETNGVDLVSVLPGIIFGPMLQHTPNASNLILLNFLKGGDEVMDNYLHMIVDVRDVAEAMILAFETPNARGRYLCTSHMIKNEDLVKNLKEIYPDYNYPKSFKEGIEVPLVSSEKLQGLGWKYKPLKQTLVDTIENCKQCAITLLTFLEEYPERANRWEAKLRDIAHETGDFIQQFLWRQAYFGEDKISRLKFEEEFRNVMEKFCLIAGDVMDERPAYPSHSLSPSASSRIAPTPNGVAIGLDDDVMAIKDRLCAVYPDLSSPPHEMRFMNDSQSWDLLKLNVFVDRNCPLELEDVGKKNARSCGGLPLAVVPVAGFLSEVNKNPSSWEEISENVNPIVGQELEGILSLSYTHLSHHLRSCFLFMSMFPKDVSIRVSRLIRLWLAEGFLKHEHGCRKSLEEEAEKYLEDLVKRNLVTVTSKKSDGKIKCCSLRAMVRDLCIRKAHDERFLRVLDGSVVRQGTINERHISFINGQHTTPGHSYMNNIWAPTIHTILYFHLKNFPGVTSFLWCYRLLRIFDAMSENSISLPSEVFDLFHLRYLALTCPSIPSAISNLMNLQTLIILPISLIVSTFYNWKRYWPSNCDPSSRFSLPLEIWRMPQLRHLILHGLILYLFPQMDRILV